MTHGKGFRTGTHALRKRCPVCKKLRRFHEPPEGVPAGSGSRNARQPRARWTKRSDGQWVCLRCVEPAAKVLAVLKEAQLPPEKLVKATKKLGLSAAATREALIALLDRGVVKVGKGWLLRIV